MVRPDYRRLALDDRRDAHAAGCADRDQRATATAGSELLRGGSDDARAGGRERMAERDARPLRIELRAIDGAQRRAPSQAITAVPLRLPGLERAKHLRGERLVDLVDIEVLQLEPRAIEHARYGIGRRHQHAF